MKTLLIIDAELGQARAYMAKTLLGAAAQKANLQFVDNPGDAELAIVLGSQLPNDAALNGKKSLAGRYQSRGRAPGAVPERSEEPRRALQRSGCCTCGGGSGRWAETYCCRDRLSDRRRAHLYGGRSY